MEPTTELVDFLTHVSLFTQVKREYLPSIVTHLQERVLSAGELIFESGDPGDAMFIIESGSVGVFLVDTAVGLKFEVARLGRGQVFGEMAVLTQKPRVATCRALQPTRCFALNRATFFAIVERMPQVALSVAVVLAGRVDQLNRDRGRTKVNLADIRVDPEVLRMVPRRILERHRMVPVGFSEGRMTLACVDPDNLTGVDEVRRLLRGGEVHRVAIDESDFYAFFEQHKASFSHHVAVKRRASRASVAWVADELRSERVEASGDEAKMLVDRIIAEAVEVEASDIHIEPELNAVNVRYRCDGSLVDRQQAPIPRPYHRAVASRIKVLASLDISERRRPQEGRMSCRVNDRSFDLRVSTMPTYEGEKIVLRVLDNADAVQPLDRLILAEKVCRVVHQMVRQPHGAVFICGPTGSGKTTTLYSALGARRTPVTNITTVEDPVEFNLPGVTQVSVNAEVGLTYPSALRSMLRQDPDVIMVGETRDPETAQMVLEAGLTGHLVLTSLHTNDAVGAIQRLREMGIENYAIASSVVGIISQRLVRRLCPNCAKEEMPSADLVARLAEAQIVKPTFAKPIRRAVGCEACDGVGYRGRVGVYELMVADDEIRQAIIDDAGQFQLREAALKGAYVPMIRYSNYLLTSGLTTAEELLVIHAGGAA